MFAFQVRNRLNAASSPRTPKDPGSPSTTAVGEIDTKAPFQSVKAAVNLFGEASPRALEKPTHKKSRTIDQERVLEKETQLHWTLKELDKFKEAIKAAESTKLKALGELEKANNTLQDLTNKLEAISESKQAEIEATQEAKARAHQLEQVKSHVTDEAWQQVLDNEIHQYKTAANQLISAKQQLTNLKQDFDTALQAKLAAFQQAADVQHAAKLNRHKMRGLSKEVHNMRHTLERVKLASAKAEQDHVNLMEEKEAFLDSKKKAKDDIEAKIQSLKNEMDDPGNLQQRLEETTEATNVLREQLKEVCVADMELLGNANEELDEAKRRLEQIKQEQTSLRDVVESFKQELENVRRDISVSKENELKREQLQAELDQIKQEVKEATLEQTKATNDLKELDLKIQEMLLEAEKAKLEEENMKKEAETLWKETEYLDMAIKEAEVKLEIAQREVEEAKAAEELANDQMRKRSSRKEAASTCDNQIMLTTEEFEALSTQVEETRSAADMKVANIMAHVEKMKERERQTLDKLENRREESKEREAELTNTLKVAEEADAARRVLEIELNKLREGTKG